MEKTGYLNSRVRALQEGDRIIYEKGGGIYHVSGAAVYRVLSTGISGRIREKFPVSVKMGGKRIYQSVCSGR